MYVRPDGTFGNRFDDPRKAQGLAQRERFRTIYCATERAGAYGETTARFRHDLHLIRELDLIDPEELYNPDEYGGVILSDWRLKRRIGMMWLHQPLPIVDLVSGETLQVLRSVPGLAHLAGDLGFSDLDMSAVTGATPNHRRLTQAIAAYVHDQRDESGQALFAGIYYPSRLNPNWKLVALFDDRLPEDVGSNSRVIRRDDPDLLRVAALFGLTIE